MTISVGIVHNDLKMLKMPLGFPLVDKQVVADVVLSVGGCLADLTHQIEVLDLN